MQQGTIYGGNSRKLSPRHSAPPEEVDTAAIHVVELRETPMMSVEMLRTRTGEWFHRVQKEQIGVQPPPESVGKADRRMCDPRSSAVPQIDPSPAIVAVDAMAVAKPIPYLANEPRFPSCRCDCPSTAESGLRSIFGRANCDLES